MNRFRIGTRLGLGFGSILFLLVLIVLVGLWRIEGSSTMTQQLLGQQLQSERLINQWSRFIAVNTVRTIAAARTDDPSIQKLFEDQMAATSVEGAQVQKQLRAALQNEQAIAMFDAVIAKRTDYRTAREAALAARTQGNEQAAKHFFQNEMDGLLNDYVRSVEALLSYQQNLINQNGSLLSSNNQLGFTLLLGLGLAALLIGIVFSWLISRSITRPLSQAVHVAQEISNRDLTSTFQIQGRDETSQLLSALQHMSQNLLVVVTDVRSSSDSIATAAGQIAAGNLDLSSRTEQQASSLAQTAATMEEITATVRQNAENAQQANSLSASAAEAATSGGSIVTQLVNTMGEINTKSQQIADIVGVIDSIAFQTNILALNAAVEAARAGEEGRGFAVVASEVRALAQRSAASAREIRLLIDSSVEAVSKGNEQAVQAGASMQDIVDGINRVTDLMGEISAANREQTTGIEEINTAVTQMDDVTRQNASLVEQSAAAARSLQEQADTLVRLVATFNLGNRPGALTAPVHVIGNAIPLAPRRLN
ncbi:MCP four helix bundle domain-containing protein [Alcaligenaceae bacterium]|nr:MCP four helix bundle domain-containing protein [Alcaligenaceae bacterium]